MKVVIFGLGSIGLRHARLLQGRKDVNVAAFRRNAVGNNLAIPEFDNWKALEAWEPQVALIANPTYLHLETALACAERGWALFIEKPIDVTTNSLSQLLKVVQRKRIPTYVAYVLRFHPKVVALKKFVEKVKVRRARLVCRSYLPDWRPGVDHRQSYSVRRKEGGGALLEVSHEFDLAQYLFGPVTEIVGRLERRSTVTVDADDFVEATVSTPSTNVEVVIDIASRELERTITVETDQGTFRQDLLERIDRDTLYRDQLCYFLEHQRSPDMMNNLKEAAPLFEALIHFRERSLS